MYNVLVPVDTTEERVMNQVEYVRDRPMPPEEIRARILYVFPREDVPR